MKRIFLSAVLMIFGMAGTANAQLMTWMETITDFGGNYVGWFDSVDYTHDLSDFTAVDEGGYDTVTSYQLTVDLSDDGGRRDRLEVAYIDQPGWRADGVSFAQNSQTLGWSYRGRASLNTDGTLAVTVHSLWGDFNINSSTLSATGNRNAPVPEPSTMLLMGAGLLGLVAYRRKQSSKKS